MRFAWVTASLLIAIFILSDCREGADSPRLTAVIKVDSSAAPEGDVMSTMSPIIDIIERRVRDLGGSGFDATVRLTEPWNIFFEFSDLDTDTARAAFETGFLEFRQPTLDASRQIICRTADGGEFHVEPSSVTQATSDDGKKEAQCTGSSGETGTVIWEPAMATDSDGELKQLTGAHVKRETIEVVTEPGQCVPACVLTEFNHQGALLFEEITTRLLSYPLGVFLDDQLIWAPHVLTIISNGQTVITGLTEREAEILSAQLNSGPVPVAFKLVSIEEVP